MSVYINSYCNRCDTEGHMLDTQQTIHDTTDMLSGGGIGGGIGGSIGGCGGGGGSGGG